MLLKHQTESCNDVFHFRVDQLLLFENYRRAVIKIVLQCTDMNEKSVRDLQILRRERLPGYDFPIRVCA